MKHTIFCLVFFLTSMTAHYSPAEETPEQRAARMTWWREARVGMFVHWGLYSGLAETWDGKPVGTRGGMEWIQQRVGTDTEAYARRGIPLFKPKAWLRSGMGPGC